MKKKYPFYGQYYWPKTLLFLFLFCFVNGTFAQQLKDELTKKAFGKVIVERIFQNSITPHPLFLKAINN